MSARNSGQPTRKPAPSPEAATVEKLPDPLNVIMDDFINVDAVVFVASRTMEECDDDDDRGAPLLVLSQGVDAFNKISDRLERAGISQERLRAKGGTS